MTTTTNQTKTADEILAGTTSSNVEEIRESFSKAFDLVSNKANWKNPITAIVHPSAIVEVGGWEFLSASVIFFTGSRPTRETLGDMELIKADGYYKAIGA